MGAHVEGSVCGGWRKSLSIRRVAMQLEKQEPPALHVCKSQVALQHSLEDRIPLLSIIL